MGAPVISATVVGCGAAEAPLQLGNAEDAALNPDGSGLGAPGSAPGVKAVDSGVIETKVLSSMTHQEAVNVCLAFADGFEALESDPLVVGAGCAIGHYNDSVAEQLPFEADACRASLSTCDGEEAPPIVSKLFSKVPPCETNDAIANAIRECDASVAEIEVCLGAMLGVFRDLFTGLDCESLDAPNFDPEIVITSLRDTDPFRDPPPHCDAVLSQCPYVFGGSAD